MLKHKRLFAALLLLFVAVTATLSVILQTGSGRAVSIHSYALVVLCCLFCGVFAEKSLPYGFTQLALVTTVCADYFLVYATDVRQLPAMLFFSVTQLCYFGRLFVTDPSRLRRRVHLILRAGLSVFAIVLTLLILGRDADAVALVSLFYYANLILNVIFSFIQWEKPPFFAVGLLLFLLCDTCVGLGNLYAYLPVDADALNRVLYGGCNLAWVFYAPSQVLLALSLLPRALKK